jgi:Uma2 family endonuclease
MAHPAATGCSVEDLDRLRNEIGVAHLELDPWGSLIVTPATDEHEAAVARLHAQALRQSGLPDDCVRSNGFAWKVPGGSGYTNLPDLTVLAPEWRRVGEYHVAPPPLLVVEVSSPSTRGVDRGRKLADYRLGGAGSYLLVDLPCTFEAYDFGAGRVMSATGSITVTVGGTVVLFDLSEPGDGRT